MTKQGITVEPSIAQQVELSTFSPIAEMVSIHSQGKYSTTWWFGIFDKREEIVIGIDALTFYIIPV